ncbi:unnamed protein product, partial [Meganyctiphanes norvegica]
PVHLTEVRVVLSRVVRFAEIQLGNPLGCIVIRGGVLPLKSRSIGLRVLSINCNNVSPVCMGRGLNLFGQGFGDFPKQKGGEKVGEFHNILAGLSPPTAI